MTHVAIARNVGLRCALLDLLASEAREMADCAAPAPLEGERNAIQARACWMCVAAVARLLDDIGWFAPSPQTCRIDVARHAWAAVRALQHLIAGQEELVRHEAALNDPEAAGNAMGRREDARSALDLIETECARSGIVISQPAP